MWLVIYDYELQHFDFSVFIFDLLRRGFLSRLTNSNLQCIKRFTMTKGRGCRRLGRGTDAELEWKWAGAGRRIKYIATKC